MPENTPVDGWLTIRQLSERTGLAQGTLRQWRAKGKGPRFVRLARTTVLYREEDVVEWEAEQRARAS